MTNPVATFGLLLGVVLFTVTVIVAIATSRELHSDTDPEHLRSKASAQTTTLDRESEYVEVVCENPDGWGTAVRETDGGLDIMSFNGNDQVYKSVWVPGKELDALADTVSVWAVELQDRDEARERARQRSATETEAES